MLLIETPRLLLRPFQGDDLPTLLAYRNDPEVSRYQQWGTFDGPGLQLFIEHMAKATPGQPGPGFQFALALRPAGPHIGDLYLRLLDYDEQQAEIGYTLARAYWGQGYAREAVAELLRYCFVDLGLHRVIAIANCENRQSIGLLERLGLRREGHFRQSVRNDSQWYDEYQYALLRSEWQEQNGRQ